MSVLTLEAKLERTSQSTPWGFRMQGGKDYSSPLTIQRVTPGSLAAKCGLQAGDTILKIGNASAEPLRHKEAQDIIISCPNKLDLLLQRGGSGQPAYDKFPVGTFSGNTGGPQGGFQTSVNFNAAPKPFGSPSPSSAPPPPPPAPVSSFGSPAVNNLSQQTQHMNISGPGSGPGQSGQSPDYLQSAQKFTERDAAPDPVQNQSRSFKFLKGLMDTGQEPPSAFGQAPSGSASPSQPGSGKVKAIMSQRYNNPIGLYSDTNVEHELEGQSKFLLKDGTGPEEQTPGSTTTNRNNPSPNFSSSEQDKRVYYPSETFKLVKERENQTPETEKDGCYAPAQSRSLRMLQDQLQSGGGITPGQAGGGAKPSTWAPPKPIHAPVAPAPMSAPWASSGPAVTPPAPPMGAPMGSGFKPSAPKPQGTSKGPLRGKKGDAVVRQQGATGADIPRVAQCAQCGNTIRGPFVVALSKTWCPDHFTCANPQCGVKLIDIGFVEEGGRLYCERDYETHFAPRCEKCKAAIIGECVTALNKSYHPQCFLCFQCKKPIGGNQFHIEDGNPYCEADWNTMFQTMCSGCNFPIEPGDRWVEAMSQNFHSECFNCSTCQVSLEGAPFYVKAGKPFCKKHVR